MTKRLKFLRVKSTKIEVTKIAFIVYVITGRELFIVG
jgi:hypothetical protein